MQPGTDQYGQPIQQAAPQPQYGQPPQPQVMGQPTVGMGVPLGNQMMGSEVQSTNAVIGLVLGILGILGSLGYGIGCLCGGIGLIITYGAKKITDANPLHPDKGTVKASLITNWIAVVLSVLMLVGLVLAGVLYVWANSLASEGTDTSASTLNTYTTEDANDEATDGANTLIRMQMTGKDDLAWSFVKVTLSVGDNVYTCSVTGTDQCDISQQAGDNENAWEPGEYIFLSEGTAEICSAQGCDVGISVLNGGNTVAGSTSQMVN